MMYGDWGGDGDGGGPSKSWMDKSMTKLDLGLLYKNQLTCKSHLIQDFMDPQIDLQATFFHGPASNIYQASSNLQDINSRCGHNWLIIVLKRLLQSMFGSDQSKLLIT
jgi:hypothetical protein